MLKNIFTDGTIAFIIIFGLIFTVTGIMGWIVIIHRKIRKCKCTYGFLKVHGWTWPGTGVIACVALIGIYYLFYWIYNSIMEIYNYTCDWL